MFNASGLETDIGAMTAKLKSSGGVKAPLYLYFATQTFNAVLTLVRQHKSAAGITYIHS